MLYSAFPFKIQAKQQPRPHFLHLFSNCCKINVCPFPCARLPKRVATFHVERQRSAKKLTAINF